MFGHPKREAVEVQVPLAATGEDPTDQHNFAKYALLQAGQEMCRKLERSSAGLIFAGELGIICQVRPERNMVQLTLLVSVHSVVAPAQLVPAAILKPGATRKVLVRMATPLFDALHAESANAQVALNTLCVHKLAATLPADYVVTGVRDRRLEATT